MYTFHPSPGLDGGARRRQVTDCERYRRLERVESVCTGATVERGRASRRLVGRLRSRSRSTLGA